MTLRQALNVQVCAAFGRHPRILLHVGTCCSQKARNRVVRIHVEDQPVRTGHHTEHHFGMQIENVKQQLPIPRRSLESMPNFSHEGCFLP